MPRKSGIGRKPKKGKKAKLSASTPVPSPPVDPGNPGVVAGTAAAAAATDSFSLTVPMEPVKRSTTVDREQQEGFYADVLDEAILHDPNDNVCVVDIALAKRMTIAYIYVKVLEEPLQFTTDEDGRRKDQWQGKGGVYAQISKVLVDMHPVGKQESSGSSSLTKTIQKVLTNISMCQESGVQYEGKINWSGGAKKKTHE